MKILPFTCALIALLNTFSRAATVYTGGSSSLGTEGSSETGEPLNGASRVQFILPASWLTTLQGTAISGLAFRLDQAYDPTLGVFGYQNYNISFGYTTDTSLSGDTFFANNLAAATGLVTVFNSSFYYAANSFSTGAAPNGFGSFIKFDVPFNYTAGNLLVTISHTDPVGADGLPYAAPSYYSADAEDVGTPVVVANSATATNGNNWNYTPIMAFTNDANLPSNASVPEPTAATLGLLCFSGLWSVRRRKQQ